MRTQFHSPFGRLHGCLAVVAAIALLSACPRARGAAVFTNMNTLNGGEVPTGFGAWGDYDNDGRLDLLLTGSWQAQTQILRNRGSGFVWFTNINAGLTPLYFASAAWGDYDQDGWLDVLMAGEDAYYNNVAQVWRNNRNGTFTNINAGLPGGAHTAVAWGDYDNDGRPDILLVGFGYAQVWRNTGNGFTDIHAGLPAVSFGTGAWGDYDNDGRLDILVTGDLLGNSIAQVWRNTGNGFTSINAGLPGVNQGDAAWGDYDNDGWLDILVSGATGNYPNYNPITHIWRNNGDGTFSNINAGLPAVQYSAVAWGDYDNDGRPDVLLAGMDTSTNRITQVWRNTGSGFVNINAGLTALVSQSVSWGDFDNDGRLDIHLAGTPAGGGNYSEVWRNISPVANTAPTAPTNLVSRPDERDEILSWAAGGDAQTPANGLSYSLRVGSAPGAADIVAPPAAMTNGLRRLPARGQVQNATTARVGDLPLGTYYWSVQAVDTAFAGSAFSEERRLEVRPPELVTLDATEVTSIGATFHGMANPTARNTIGWFEYGLAMRYGSTTSATALGNGTNLVPFQLPAQHLLPWMTYHFRTVVSNRLGISRGPDNTVTLPGPSLSALTVSELTDVVLLQGGSTSVWFTVSPSDAEVRVRGNNPVLLPSAALAPGGSGNSRSLSLAPAASHSGSARITVFVGDGSRCVSRAFNLTVTPSAAGGASTLYLTNAQAVSAGAWRFRLVDAAAGSTNHSVEYRSDLGTTNAWMPATNVTALGDGVFEVAIGPPQPGRGFYRATGFRLLLAGLDSAAVTAEEGAGTAGPVLVFNGPYTGLVTCVWTDPQGTSWTNQVEVNGTTAATLFPAAYGSDNATIGQLRYLTLQLQDGTGFDLGATADSAVTIEENDADWQGMLQTPDGNLAFRLSLLQSNGQLQGQIKSAGSGFFPTNSLAQLNLTENSFLLVATNIVLPMLADSPTLRFTNYADLRLEAANGPSQTNISPTRLQGAAMLVSKAPGCRYLDAAVFGSFELLKPATASATNEVPLYPAP